MESIFEFLFKYKLFLFEKGRIALESPVWPWLFPVLALGLAVGLYWLNRNRKGAALEIFEPTSPTPRRISLWALIALRSLVLAALLVMLLQPTLVVATLLPRENIVAVLVDDSKSMTLRDVGEGTRLDAVKKLLNPGQRTFLNELEQRFQTRLFSFSRENQRLRSASELKAEGKRTSLEGALQGVLREFASSPLVSVVLISDGADNSSGNLGAVLNELRSRKITVSSVGVGKTSIDRDIEIVQASAPGSVLPGSVTQAVVSLKSAGFGGREVMLEIREDGKLVNSKQVQLEGTEEPQVVDLDLIPKGNGVKSYTVSVRSQEGEAITVNNERKLLLNVEDTQPKILYLEGTPRWEFKFIRQALQKDKNLQLVTLLRTSGNKFYRQGVESEDNLASGFPASREELFQYKALILGSIESSFFSKEQAQMVADFVSQRGGGFMMLGGKTSFDAGNYKGTVIADVLPVVLGERAQANSFTREPTKIELTSYGKNHPITRLVTDEAQNEVRWNSLPVIGDFNVITRTKPGATVLARGRGSRTPVLLAAQRYGRGRALAFMADSSWRWRMEMPSTDNSHQIFWRQTMRWLVGSAPDQVNLDLGGGVFSEEDTVRVGIDVNDPGFRGVNDAEVNMAIVSPGGKTTDLPVKWSGQKDGLYVGAFRPEEKGVYQVRATANRDGKEVGVARQYVVVGDSNQEFFSAGQNEELLSHVAAQTGGKYYPLGRAGQIPEELVYQERPNSLPQYLPLWDMPILFLIVASALLAEWFLRRRGGLA
ncbi:MAG: VWA domain-containing protein [Acidobacteria bacterium]|nr:MAG: VWA domain-containing protein [Acidobacteriota bacterium]